MVLRAATLAAKFGLVLFITRFLDLESLGIYGLVVGTTIILPVMMGLGLQNSLAREAVGQPLEKLTVNLRNYWALMGGMYFLAGAVGSIFFAKLGYLEFLLIILTIIFLEHINQDLFVILVNLEQPLFANTLNFIRSAGWIFIFIIFALVDPAIRTMDALFLFWLVGLIVPLLLFLNITRFWPWRKAFSTLPSPIWYWSHIKKSRLLFVSDLLFAAGQYVDRYLITIFLGLELAGVYVFYWQVGNALYNLINTGIMQIYRPKMIRSFNQKDEISYWLFFRECLNKTLKFGIYMSFFSAGFVFLLLSFLNNKLIAIYFNLIWLVFAAMVVRLTLLVISSAQYSRRKDINVLINYALVAVVVNISILVLLIFGGGLYQVGFFMVIAYIIVLVTQYRTIGYDK